MASGAPLAPLDAAGAAAAARDRFDVAADVVDATLVSEAAGEYRDKPVPAWRVAFDDDLSTHVYVDAASGEVTSVRNDVWRRFDFFWMLHIMDYEGRTDFGTPWLHAAAWLGVASALSGLLLAAVVVRPRGARAR